MSINGPMQRQLENAAIATGDLAKIEAAAPPVPPETCPAIDFALLLTDSIQGDLGTMREGMQFTRRKTVPKDELIDDLLDREAGLSGLKLRLEELRTANDQLRRSGAYWHRAARELAKAAGD